MSNLQTSLSRSFRKVPPAAVPALLECILTSTDDSPAALFASLLPYFSNLIQEFSGDCKKMSAEESVSLVSYMHGLCHLLKKIGADTVAVEGFMWEAFIPLMKIIKRESLHEVVQSFLEVVKEMKCWDFIEQTLVPYLLRSVALSMDITQTEEKFVITWSGQSVYLSLTELLTLDAVFEKIPVLPLTLLCYLMSCLLETANENSQPLKGYSIASDAPCAEKFGGHLLWNLCNLTLEMFSQRIELRSCSVSVLLPSVLKAFALDGTCKICIQGKNGNISRQHYFMKLWKCAKMLFALGSLERRDGCGIIALYLSHFPCVDGLQVEMGDEETKFDIRAEKEFWAEIKRGLVEKEGLIRKHTLLILKKVVFLNEGENISSNVTEKMPHEKGLQGKAKRDRWAEEEAQSLGIRKLCFSVDECTSQKQKWEAFILLYEMLEEFGTHLVEAAWNHQIMLLLQSSVSHDNSVNLGVYTKEIDLLGRNFDWLAILWERGLFHDNPLVRCLIMKSFLEVEWKSQENCRQLFSEDFILGAFMQGLNDPVHHKDFGMKGLHSSKTIEAASKFMQQYCSSLHGRELRSFLCRLAFVAREQSLSRAGLMSLSECIVSASISVSAIAAQGHINGITEAEKCHNALADANGLRSHGTEPYSEKASLIDNLKFLVENSKQHFNPKYRLRVCENMVEAAASVVFAHELPLETLLHFIGALPREFTDRIGSLRMKVQKWLAGNYKRNNRANSSAYVLSSVHEFPARFITCNYSSGVRVPYDDEDLAAWFAEADRWTRVMFLLADEDYPMEPLFEFLEEKGVNICQQSSEEPTKYLVLLLSLVHELEFMQKRTVAEAKAEPRTGSKPEPRETVEKIGLIPEKFADIFLILMDKLVLFSESSCSIFWSEAAVDCELPGSVTGKLGGPSQRRLPSYVTTAVLQAIVSMRTMATVSSWCVLQRGARSFNFPFTYMWHFFDKVVSSALGDSESSAEIRLAAYEASSFVLGASVRVISTPVVKLIQEMNNSPGSLLQDGPILDALVLKFLSQINAFLAVQQLVRARRAVLMNWKWLCLEAILSIPCHAHRNGVQLGRGDSFFSDDAIRLIFADIVESLENAGECSVLPMLRSVRTVLDLLTSASAFVSSCHGVNVQMIWQLVRSAWILHTSCNKRRVAPIAALLSSVMHASVFQNEDMHVVNEASGPLKWFCEKILEEGTKSPRTIRLAALHLTGLWLFNPRILKYYMKELKLLTLYGSVAFDEDFEAELSENGDANSEVLLLAKGPDNDMSEAYINTELYARVSVAVLFYNLGEVAKKTASREEPSDCCAAVEAGKLFLLELLDSAVNDKDIAKELYKKYSAIHRRKVRTWQMICILSRFVRQDIVQRVLDYLSKSLHRNNLPAVRQYLETFAIRLYLDYPVLVKEHLVPILGDYEMKTQALSSYVFIAANIMLHSKANVQSKHLAELLPPIIPLLTSHHHSLRGFTQLLVYQVFCKLLPEFDFSNPRSVTLEESCFRNLKTYLAQNPDCRRLRASMEGYLDAFNPDVSVTPAGIFSNRVEDLEFECVPMSLMEQVMNFLNDVREELRSAMSKDDVTLKKESLMKSVDPEYVWSSANAGQELSLVSPSSDLSLDFQKKFTLAKHDTLLNATEEDKLLEQILHSRILSVEKLKASRQHIIIVASLLDRIPNLAGLARTCEVFKASALVVADASVLKDKQFQLISVTAEKWVPIIEVPVNSIKNYLEKKKLEGFSILGLEQTANSMPLDKYSYPQRTVLVLGREKEGIPADIIHILDGCVEIPQLGVVRSLNVHVSGAIAIWEYTRQQRPR